LAHPTDQDESIWLTTHAIKFTRLSCAPFL
jgi:hypothetical protein